MASDTFEAALERTMASGVPVAVARATSTETPELLAPSRSVLGFLSVLPTVGNFAGDSYVLTAGSFLNNIGIFGADGVWHYVAPESGYTIFDQSIGLYRQYISNAWVVATWLSNRPKARNQSGNVTASSNYTLYEFSATGTFSIPASLGVSVPYICRVRNKSGSALPVYLNNTGGTLITTVAAQSDGGGAGWAEIEIDGADISVDGNI